MAHLTEQHGPRCWSFVAVGRLFLPNGHSSLQMRYHPFSDSYPFSIYSAPSCYPQLLISHDTVTSSFCNRFPRCRLAFPFSRSSEWYLEGSGVRLSLMPHILSKPPRHVLMFSYGLSYHDNGHKGRHDR